VTRFPLLRSEAEADEGGWNGSAASKAPKLVECRHCGQYVWRNADGAHAACTIAAGGTPTPVPQPGTDLERVIGNVYATITTDPEAAQVSESRARQIAAEAQARVDRAPRCTACHRPLVLGQRGIHHSCRPATEEPETL
jgi:uncharacterized protein with PIN domain